ncbi:MAG TPA: PAS domain-containing protein [Phycisphaeraceae bacterium]
MIQRALQHQENLGEDTRLPGLMRWTLRNRIALVVLGLLPVVLLAFYSLHVATASVYHTVQRNNQNAARLAAAMIDREIHDSLLLAETFASLSSVKDAVVRHDEDATRQVLAMLVQSQVGIDRTFVTDPEGRLWSDYPNAPESIGQDRSGEDWYQGVSKGWLPYVSRVYRRHTEPEPLVVAVATPIRQGNEVVGILVYQYRLATIAGWLGQVTLGEQGYAFLVDHTGNVATHPRLDLAARLYGEYRGVDLLQHALQGRQEMAEYVDPLTQRRVIASFAPVAVSPGQYWAVAAQLPVDEAYAPIRRLKLLLSIGGGVMALLAATLVSVLGRVQRSLQQSNEALLREIDRRRQYEQALQESQSMYASLVEQLPMGIFRKDPAGRYMFCNHRFAALHQTFPDQLRGKTDDDLHPAAQAQQHRTDDQQVLQTALTLHRVEPFPSDAGGLRYLERIIAPLYDAQGQVAGVQGALWDVTDRIEAEQRIRQTQQFLDSIVEHIPQMIFVKRFPDLRFVRLNKAGEELTGYSRDQLIGKSDHDLFPSEEADFFTRIDRQVLEDGRMYEVPEETIHTRHKGVRFLHTRKVPLKGPDGQPAFLLGISEDITERKEAQQKLQETAEALRRSNRELEQFAYIASHDLQEPLRKIQGFGDMLKTRAGEALDEQSLDYLQRMQNAAGRMQELITGLLTSSRVTTKARPFEPVDLRRIAEQVVGDLEMRIRQTGGQVEIGPLLVIDADPLQMRQLFQNLISNALTFHREGVPPRVRVVSRRVDQARRCQIRVEDNGIGFDEEDLDRIFKPFQRLHNRSSYEGTGIGLAVCQKIVERHGGTITAKSAIGRGSTFIVTLPCRHDHGETPHAP